MEILSVSTLVMSSGVYVHIARCHLHTYVIKVVERWLDYHLLVVTVKVKHY